MDFNRIILAAALAALPFSAYAQSSSETEFTVVKENPVTSVKDQDKSGTCWAFSTISFLESEAIRINNLKKEAYPDFSEMFIVSYSYRDRAEKYVRTDGHINLGPGSECDDVLEVMDTYGLVPQDIMPGTNYGTVLPNHKEVDAAALAYMDAIVKNPNKTLSTAWKNGFKGIMDAYFGEAPTEFEYNGVKHTPQSYRDSYKLDRSEYVSLTSFTHHPFYKPFALELSDNWRWSTSYNIPIDEFWSVIYNAVMDGYTVAWAGDVSEPEFKSGKAVLPDTKKESTAGSDQERWTGKKAVTKQAATSKERLVTQESRQIEFDNKQTTDDHGMHVFGVAKDSAGSTYLMLKNSWGTDHKYKGIWYMSEAYCKGKAIIVTLHKDALPKELINKLGI